MLVVPLRMLGMWVGQAQRATASGERIFEVMDEPEEIADEPDATELPPGDGRVRYEGVSFEYAPGRPVLHEIDLELEPGRTVALIGHTGSGQDDARSARAPLLRRDRRTDARSTASTSRDVTLQSLRREIGVVAAGSVPLLGDRPREHRLRRARTRRTKRSSARRGSRRRTSSSRRFRTATTP